MRWFDAIARLPQSRTVVVNQSTSSLKVLVCMVLLFDSIEPRSDVMGNSTVMAPLACMLAAVSLSLVATESLNWSGIMSRSDLI